MCTVHSFPHNIDHCLTWARSEFEGMLDKAPGEANAYLADPDKCAMGARGWGWRCVGLSPGLAAAAWLSAAAARAMPYACAWCPADYHPMVLPPRSPSLGRRYIQDVRTSADAAAREQLARVVEVLVGERVADFDGCIRWARLKFEDYFHNRCARRAGIMDGRVADTCSGRLARRPFGGCGARHAHDAAGSLAPRWA